VEKEQILRYILVPYLEEAATLLFTARKFLPIWAVKRSEQLKYLACTLTSRVGDLRRVVFSWASERDEDYFFCTSFDRVLREESEEGDTDTSESSSAFVHSISVAVECLFALVPVIEKINKLTYDRGEVKWIYEIIESLKELPAYSYVGPIPEVSYEIRESLHLHPIFSECYALSFTQGYVESLCLPKGKTVCLKKRENNQIFSIDQLKLIAERTKFPFSLLKSTFLPEVVESKESPWYMVAREYDTLVEEKKNAIISTTFPFGVTELKDAWNDGHIHPSIPSYLYGHGKDEKCLASETVTRNLMLLLILFAGTGCALDEDEEMIKKLVHV
jgi:hypothetical protein